MVLFHADVVAISFCLSTSSSSVQGEDTSVERLIGEALIEETY
jgi:hypothetical protein